MSNEYVLKGLTVEVGMLTLVPRNMQGFSSLECRIEAIGADANTAMEIDYLLNARNLFSGISIIGCSLRPIGLGTRNGM
jgi:hypothetical protein